METCRSVPISPVMAKRSVSPAGPVLRRLTWELEEDERRELEDDDEDELDELEEEDE